MNDLENQYLIWDYCRQRHIHTWNRLQLAVKQLAETNTTENSEIEYEWENLVIRMVIYRYSARNLVRLKCVKKNASKINKQFDSAFRINGTHVLMALYNRFEHFDTYHAIGKGKELDPHRTITVEEYNHGTLKLQLSQCIQATTELRNSANEVSHEFIEWYKRESVCVSS